MKMAKTDAICINQEETVEDLGKPTRPDQSDQPESRSDRATNWSLRNDTTLPQNGGVPSDLCGRPAASLTKVRHVVQNNAHKSNSQKTGLHMFFWLASSLATRLHSSEHVAMYERTCQPLHDAVCCMNETEKKERKHRGGETNE